MKHNNINKALSKKVIIERTINPQISWRNKRKQVNKVVSCERQLHDIIPTFLPSLHFSIDTPNSSNPRNFPIPGNPAAGPPPRPSPALASGRRACPRPSMPGYLHTDRLQSVIVSFLTKLNTQIICFLI